MSKLKCQVYTMLSYFLNNKKLEYYTAGLFFHFYISSGIIIY